MAVAELSFIRERCQEARARGLRIALANGAFDMLHVGHLRYLQGAKAVADILIVAVNNDASVRRSKGEGRPVVPDLERAELVAGLAAVDWVLIFGEDTVAQVLEELRPDFHVKGTDYTAESVPEAALVKSYGGQVVIAGDAKNHSTTDLVSRLRRL